MSLYRCVLKQATAAVLLRTGLASATAIMAGASPAGAFDDRPADETAAFASTSEPVSGPSETRSNAATYAQLFWLERLFAPPPPEVDRRQTKPRDTTIRSRDRFGRPGPTYRVLGVVPKKAKTRRLSQGDSLKLRIAQQLRQAPPAPPTQGPLLLAVSIAKQTVTLYDAGVAIAKSPVSTGTASHPTPTGIFSVIEKQWWHRSNLYSAAPMPFMQRITWTGVALHSGELPGYAASHGCIRLPEAFALRLWGTTKIGARVIVTRDEAVPVEIAHARLFTPKAKAEPALEPKPEEVAPPEKITPPESKPQSEEMSISVNVPAPALAPTLSLAARQIDRTLEREHVAPSEPAPRSVESRPVIVTPPAYVGGGPRVIVVEEAQAQLDAANPAADEDDEVADNDVDDATRDALRHVELIDPDNTVINGTAEVTVTRPGQPPETLLLAVEKMPTDADQPAPVAEPRVMLASLDAASVPLPSLAPSQAMPNTQLAARRRSAPREPSVEMSAMQPHVLRPGPISVLVSRKDQRMYVRKGFEPLFDAPITVAKPHEPIGTYLFTAVAPGADQTALRWVVLPIEPSSSAEHGITAENRASGGQRSRAPERIDPKVKAMAAARAALDRLDLPQEAVERISELVSVGATLIVTERGLSRREAAALDSDFTVQTDTSPVKPRPRARPRPRKAPVIQPL